MDDDDPPAPPHPARAVPPVDPAVPPGAGALDRLAETARDYARSAAAPNTRRAYAADWAAFTRWCRRRGVAPLPAAPDAVGLYLAHLADPDGAGRSVATIERRLSGLAWNAAQRGAPLDLKDPHIRAVLAGIRRRHARPPAQKAALGPQEVLAMADALPRDLMGLRDRAILLLGYAGALRRSEITGLDRGPDESADGRGWIRILAPGAILTLNAKTGWREVEVGRGSSERSCPVHALERWLHFARIEAGPVFRRVARDGRSALPHRLTDRHVARLVKRTILAAGIRADLPEPDRLALFSGHSLRAGLATAAAATEADIQRHLGHATPTMTRRYQRHRDRFRTNLTKAAGL